jgi:hypothetical protein
MATLNKLVQLTNLIIYPQFLEEAGYWYFQPKIYTILRFRFNSQSL